VTSVRVVRGLPMGLEQSAIQAVSQWKFQPAMLDNRPVAVYFSLTVQFEVR
jgi:TonB family protein